MSIAKQLKPGELGYDPELWEPSDSGTGQSAEQWLAELNDNANAEGPLGVAARAALNRAATTVRETREP